MEALSQRTNDMQNEAKNTKESFKMLMDKCPDLIGSTYAKTIESYLGNSLETNLKTIRENSKQVEKEFQEI